MKCKNKETRYIRISAGAVRFYDYCRIRGKPCNQCKSKTKAVSVPYH